MRRIFPVFTCVCVLCVLCDGLLCFVGYTSEQNSCHDRACRSGCSAGIDLKRFH